MEHCTTAALEGVTTACATVRTLYRSTPQYSNEARHTDKPALIVGALGGVLVLRSEEVLLLRRVASDFVFRISSLAASVRPSAELIQTPDRSHRAARAADAD